MHKYFLQDKNYILKGAQLDLREELISQLIDTAKDYYQKMHNPLGLMDDTMVQVAEHSGHDIDAFDDVYEVLSAIYRYRHGSPQLEFLFDGLDHYSKYSSEWAENFSDWLVFLFRYEPFLKTVLQITVFKAEGHSRLLAIGRLRNYVFQQFEIRVYKHKGLVEKVA